MAKAPVAESRAGISAWVERQLEALSPRDRRLLAGLVGFGALAFAFGVWWVLSGMLSEMGTRVRSSNEKLAQIMAMKAELDEANERLAAQEGRLAQFRSQPVGAWVERLAATHGVQNELRSVDETGREDEGALQQITYKVELKKAPYDPMLEFLYGLESSGYPAQIEVATIKSSTGKDKTKVYDLTLEIVVYQVGGAG
jgi:type II secretory pathway component PulM